MSHQQSMQSLYVLLCTMMQIESYGRSGTTESQKQEAFLQMRGLVEGAGLYDPAAPVGESGLPLLQALIDNKNVTWSPGWMDTLTHGGAVMEAGGATLLQAWMDKRVVAHARQRYNHAAVNALTTKWLIEKTPEALWDPKKAGEWITALTGIEDPHLQIVSSDVRKRGCVESLPPEKTPARWSKSVTEVELAQLDPGAPVLLPSGTVRTLDEMWTLRGMTPHGRRLPVPTSLKLENLPHKRRDDLALRALEPSLTIDEGRRRLWSAIREKSEVLDAFMQKGIFGKTEGIQARARQILDARDEEGRGIEVFLLGTLRADSYEMTTRLPSKMEREFSYRDPKGRGIIEQVLDSAERRSWDTMMGRYNFGNLEQSVASERLTREDILGASPEQQARAVNLLIDMQLPGGDMRDAVGLVNLVATDDEKARLRQAMLLSLAIKQTKEVFRDEGSSSSTASRTSAGAKVKFHEKVIQSWRAALTDPIVLALDTTDWQQWKDLVFRPIMGDKPHWLDEELLTQFEETIALGDSRFAMADLDRGIKEKGPAGGRGRI